MKKIDVLHVYAGTGGSAGLYIDEIYSTLQENYAQECLVNYYFPFKYGKKIFYKLTEMTGSNVFSKTPRVRLMIRMIELILALFYSLMFILIKKPSVINYSMTSNFKVELFFLKLVKKFSSAYLVITCHDVLPFQTGYSDMAEDIKVRKKFFMLADRLLVHNENSKVGLIEHFGISKSKICIHKFPIMSLAKLADVLNINIDDKTETRESRRFLFVGHLRKEKGVELLIEAWSADYCAELLVAGNVPSVFNYKFKAVEGSNFKLINKFISEGEYIKLISESDFVLLPYTGGTNSGIPSSVVSLGSIPVTSKIDMFVNNELIDKAFMFDAGDSLALSEKIEELMILSAEDLGKAKAVSRDLFLSYKTNFNSEIRNLYKSLLSR